MAKNCPYLHLCLALICLVKKVLWLNHEKVCSLERLRRRRSEEDHCLTNSNDVISAYLVNVWYIWWPLLFWFVHVESLCVYSNQVHFVFDSYIDGSTKDSKYVVGINTVPLIFTQLLVLLLFQLACRRFRLQIKTKFQLLFM